MKVIVSKTCAKLTDAEQLTSGLVGKVLDIEYSAEWSGLTVVAVFSNGAVTKDVLNPGNACVIPHEILASPNKHATVGFYGYVVENGEKVIAIPTVLADLGRIAKGADPSGDPSAELSPTVAEQLQADVNDLDERVTYIEEHGGGGGIPDAPVDGKQYARQDGEWAEVQSGGGQGWTDEQIDLLEAVFEKLVYTDAEGGELARQLINSLRGGVIPEEPITITFDGTKAVISGLGNTTITYSGTTAKIGYMPL